MWASFRPRPERALRSGSEVPLVRAAAMGDVRAVGAGLRRRHAARRHRPGRELASRVRWSSGPCGGRPAPARRRSRSGDRGPGRSHHGRGRRAPLPGGGAAPARRGRCSRRSRSGGGRRPPERGRRRRRPGDDGSPARPRRGSRVDARQRRVGGRGEHVTVSDDDIGAGDRPESAPRSGSRSPGGSGRGGIDRRCVCRAAGSGGRRRCERHGGVVPAVADRPPPGAPATPSEVARAEGHLAVAHLLEEAGARR